MSKERKDSAPSVENVSDDFNRKRRIKIWNRLMGWGFSVAAVTFLGAALFVPLIGPTAAVIIATIGANVGGEVGLVGLGGRIVERFAAKPKKT